MSIFAINDDISERGTFQEREQGVERGADHGRADYLIPRHHRNRGEVVITSIHRVERQFALREAVRVVLGQYFLDNP